MALFIILASMEKIDMHIFTTVSHPTEGAPTPKEAVKIALKRGMNGLGMADHDLMGASKEAQGYAPKDFILLGGVEIRALEGHVVAFGIEKCDLRYAPLAEVLDFIRDNDGLVLLPHPNIDIMQVSIKEPHINRFKDYFDGMYLLSTRHMLFYSRIKEVHDTYGFTGLGCSYAHHPYEVGTAFTLFDGVSNEDDVIAAIRKNRVVGPRILKTPQGLFNIARSNSSIVKKFTFYKFGLELKRRIPLYHENIWKKIIEMKEFSRKSLLEELFRSDKLPPDSRRDTLLTLTLDYVLETATKDGELTRSGEKYILNNASEKGANGALYMRVYSKYLIGLIRDIIASGP
jgi:predicted metal-dependent phosphoesterase TrpH